MDLVKFALLFGMWRAVFVLHDGVELPVIFEVKQDDHGHYEFVLMNGRERINVNEIAIHDDSITIKLPIFDTEISGTFNTNRIDGNFINHSRTTDNIIPFHATFGPDNRFHTRNRKPSINLTDSWEVHFSQGTKDSSVAIGEFLQHDDHLEGTFLTPSGDFRYLEGFVDDSTFGLSSFDGAHLFLFMGKMKPDGTLAANFWSGAHWKEPWIARHNKDFDLPDEYSLTHLKPGYDKIAFRFPDLDSNMVSLTDERFQNKVVILQLMGSWCPNCMDETIFLNQIYNKYHSRGVEIAGLAFEKTGEFQKAKSNILRLKERLNVPYPILIAGTSAKEDAIKKLPMLDNIYAYPTTILIDKNGNLREIHTGYSGPATGDYYKKFVDEFNSTLQSMLSE